MFGHRERARATAKQPTIDEREIVYVEVRGFNFRGRKTPNIEICTFCHGPIWLSRREWRRTAPVPPAYRSGRSNRLVRTPRSAPGAACCPLGRGRARKPSGSPRLHTVRSAVA